jgi:hypothetical protein
MRLSKNVSEKKLYANRRNARLSTGPRSERGKLAVRHNALTFGLFAKDIVIVKGDGRESEAEFHALLDELAERYHPVGPLEEWLVARIAVCLWRLRRATRAENGAIVLWNGDAKLKAMVQRSENLRMTVSTLPYARERLMEDSTSIAFLISVLQGAAEQTRKANRSRSTGATFSSIALARRRREVFLIRPAPTKQTTAWKTRGVLS